MLKGFRDFILRGNVVDLAVAVIIGAAFAAITNSLVADIINPFIAAIVGKPDFSAIVWHLSFHPAIAGKPDANAGVIQVGKFLNNVIAFVLNAAVVYFVIVLPVQKLLKRLNKPVPPGPPTTKPCPQCLSDIPIPATRCKFCTQPV
jgi:large conductance mechanosensitive channel